MHIYFLLETLISLLMYLNQLFQILRTFLEFTSVSSIIILFLFLAQSINDIYFNSKINQRKNHFKGPVSASSRVINSLSDSDPYALKHSNMFTNGTIKTLEGAIESKPDYPEDKEPVIFINKDDSKSGPLSCPKCGNQLNFSDKICPTCGYRAENDHSNV